MFNFLKNKSVETIDEKLKRYESITYQEIYKIISKLPRSRREAFLDRLTGNIYNPKVLTEEEKNILLEKYDSKEYEFILNVRKSLEEKEKEKELIKKRYEKTEEIDNVKNEEESEEELDSEEDEDYNEEESYEGTNNFYENEEESFNDEENNDEILKDSEIPEDNWNPLDFFCEKCYDSFRLTQEEKEKIDKKEIKEIICKKCGKTLSVNEENIFDDEDYDMQDFNEELARLSEEENTENIKEDDKEEKIE